MAGTNEATIVQKLGAIGDAIRAKTGGSAKLTLAEMPDEIASIGGGGGPFEQYTEMLSDPQLQKFTREQANAMYDSVIRPFLMDKCGFVEAPGESGLYTWLYDPLLCKVNNIGRIAAADEVRTEGYTMFGQSTYGTPRATKYLGAVCKWDARGGFGASYVDSVPTTSTSWPSIASGHNGYAIIARNLVGVYHATESGLKVMSGTEPVPAAM